jgi:uncharacterized protein (DUF302 family)
VTVEGLITLRSSFPYDETLARFEAAVRANGMSTIARLDHAAAASDAGLPLGATTLLMFGNSTCQAVLVKALRILALDLPFKALIWVEASNQTWVAYNDLRWLAKRYAAASEEARPIIDMAVTVDGIARKAVLPP